MINYPVYYDDDDDDDDDYYYYHYFKYFRKGKRCSFEAAIHSLHLVQNMSEKKGLYFIDCADKSHYLIFR